MAGLFKAPAGLSKGKTTTKTDPLSQRIPVNPKYKDVRPTVDTGASVTKQLERIKELKANYKFKKGEIFKRMRVTSLVALMIEVAEMNRAVDGSSSSSNTRAEGTPDEPSASSTVVGDGGSVGSVEEPAEAQAPTGDDSAFARPLSVAGSSSTLPDSRPSMAGRSTRSSNSSRSATATSAASPFYFPHPSSLCRSTDGGVAVSSRPSSAAAAYSRPASSLRGIIGGFGEKTSLDEEEEEGKENVAAAADNSLSPPYLLIDVREEEAFAACRLRTAKHFPSSRLSRAFQFETPELRSFRNGPGKIIVVYDEDETMAPRAATILVERGYDNVFMLSGGINVATKFFPDGLVIRSPSAQTPPLRETGRAASAASATTAASSASATTAGSSTACATAAASSTSTTTAASSTASSSTPVSSSLLSAEEVSLLRPKLDEAKLASSPAHRPSVSKKKADRRKTQMFGGQVKRPMSGNPTGMRPF